MSTRGSGSSKDPERGTGSSAGERTTHGGSRKAKVRSERRQEALREVRDLFETLASNMLDGLAMLDWQGTVLYANRAAYVITGLRPRKNPAGLNVARVIHPEDHQRIIDELLQVREGRGGFISQYRVLTPGGKIRWIETVGQKVTFRGTEASLVTIRDITGRKNDEEALRVSTERLKLSEKKYAEAFHLSPLAISISDPETGTIVDVNEAYEALTGFSREELVGNRALSIGLWANPADRERYIKELRSLRKIDGFQATLRKKDGSLRDVVLSASVIRVGGVSHLQNIVHDVTDQKRAEERLLLSEKKFSLAFHASPDAMAITERESGRFFDVNRAFESRTGYSRDELLGHTTMDLNLWVSSKDRDRFVAEVDEKKELGMHETRLRTRDGRIRDILFSAGTIEIGDKAYILTLARDITDRKRMEGALRQSEERYRRITSAITDYIYTVYLEEGNVVRTVHSPACEAVTGYRPEDFEKDHFLWYSMVEEDDREAVRAHFNQVTTGVKMTPIEHRIRRKDGSVRWVSNMPVIHRDASGTMISYDGVVSDITERKRAERELKESEERFRALHDASFGGIAIHDRGKILDCNQGLSEISGYPREELIGMNCLHVVTEASRDLVMQNILVGKETPYDAEGLRKDGTIYPLEIRAKNIPYHGRTVRVAEFRDITERKRWEETLTESEERYRLMAELTGKLVYDLDVQSGRITWHGAVSQLTGFDPEEFKAVDMRSWNAMIHPEDRGDTMTTLEAALHECGPYQTEYRLCRKDGTFINVEDHGVFLGDAQGKAYHVLGSIGDITGRKQAEEDLRESEERYHSLFDNSHVVMLLIEPESGRIVDANPAACSYYGYTREEITSRRITEFNTLSSEQVYAEMERARSLQRRSFVFKHRLADGEVRDVEVFSGPIVVAGKTLLSSIVHDITERRRAEDALKESEERFRSLIQNSADIIVILDGNGLISYETPSFSRVLGYSPGHMLGRNPIELIHPDDVQKVLGALGDVYRDINDGVPTEFRLRKADGTWIHLEAIGNNLLNYPGIDGVVITARDITDRKKAEDLRLEMERRLLHAQRLESLGVMAGGIAHDFNNLLMAILGNLDLAQMDLSPVARSRPFIDHALVAARRAADLTNQMLAYSGKGKFDLKAFDLSELVEEMSHLLRASISKTVTLNLQAARDLPPIKADPGQIQQIVMNLIVNASEAIGDTPGVVTVITDFAECTVEDLKQSRLKEKPAPGRFVFLEVRDTGCGMDEATMDRLFDPFFTTKFTGRGLGLAAASGIITGHGGAIMVESKPGRGTSIRVLLPAAGDRAVSKDRDAGRSESRETGPEKVTASGGTVLVVDDEEMVRDLCRSMVERLGYSVVTASDGEEALVVYREHAARIACVILDLTMPKKDGMETLDELKRRDDKVKVILSSGFNEQEITQRFMGKDLAGFIQKPYRLEVLRSELERVLGDG